MLKFFLTKTLYLNMTLLLAANFILCCSTLSLNHLGPVHKHHIIKQTLFQYAEAVSTKSFNTHPAFTPSSNPIISITEFGGDYKGISDSTTAFENAISSALKYGSPSHNMSGFIKDCGGVTIDLQGGDYLISSTLRIPPYFGNIHMIDGTIRASKNFTYINNNTNYLLMIGNYTNNCGQYNCNQNIYLENLMLDCQHNCDGVIYINHCIGCIIGPGIIIHGFNQYGINAVYSHGTLIFAAWIGQFWWLSNDYNNYTKVDSIAIELNAPDSNLRDLIIFSARFGIRIHSVNDMLSNIHCWNYDQTLAPNKSALTVAGIIIESGAQTIRITDSYLDWVNLVIVNPNNVIIEDSLFFGGGTIILKAIGNQTVHSLIMMNNQYSSGDYDNYTNTIIIDETNGYFVDIIDTIIENLIIDAAYNRNKYLLKSTKVQRKLTKYGANQWIFDLSDYLLFDNVGIGWIGYSFQLLGDQNKTVQHNLLQFVGKTVIIQTNVKCDGTVYLTVDQSTPPIIS